MPDDVICRIEQMAQKKDSYFVFQDRHGNLLFEKPDDPQPIKQTTDDDEEYDIKSNLHPEENLHDEATGVEDAEFDDSYKKDANDNIDNDMENDDEEAYNNTELPDEQDEQALPNDRQNEDEEAYNNSELPDEQDEQDERESLNEININEADDIEEDPKLTG
jgi:hypothetical protein